MDDGAFGAGHRLQSRGATRHAPSFGFAGVQQGRDILTNRDEFVRALSPFDRAARLKTDKIVSEQEYLEFVGRNVLDWNAGEKVLIQSACADLRPRLEALALPFPEAILFIKTTGLEEGGAEYTRSNAIILPQSSLKSSDLRGVVAHELFHVLSRKNPALRDKLYAAIGFQNCGEVTFPPDLAGRKITNPDAPRNDHCIKVEAGGESLWVVPILFSKLAHYDGGGGGDFFRYLNFQYLVVTRKDSGASAAATYDLANPRLLPADKITGFFEQIGRNTDYIIHPEEILADNFKLLLLQKSDVASPEILEKIRLALASRIHE